MDLLWEQTSRIKYINGLNTCANNTCTMLNINIPQCSLRWVWMPYSISYLLCQKLKYTRQKNLSNYDDTFLQDLYAFKFVVKHWNRCVTLKFEYYLVRYWRRNDVKNPWEITQTLYVCVCKCTHKISLFDTSVCPLYSISSLIIS